MTDRLLKTIKLFTLGLFVLLWTTSVWAQATFGAEFTFTNQVILDGHRKIEGAIVNSEESERFRDLMAKQVQLSCGNCKIITGENAYGVKTYSVVYPDGYYFVIATDPAVVEVQTKPQTADEIAKNMERIQRDIFDAAKKVGMAPSLYGTGGGHIHMGFQSATQRDLRLFRNIVVDFANHAEIASGILNKDYHNSPPIAELPESRIAAFKQIIAEVDAGKIISPVVFSRRIQNEVYNWHVADWAPNHKYHALNLTRIADRRWSKDEQTLEFRSIKPQQNAREFELLVRLLQGRVDYLELKKEPIAVDIRKPRDQFDMLERFSRYVAEAGMDFAEMRSQYRFSLSATQFATVYPPLILCKKVLK